LIHAILGQGCDGAVSHAVTRRAYLNDTADRQLGEVCTRRESHVMAAPIEAVDDQVGRVGQLIGDALRRDATDDRRRGSPGVEYG
jgi:hypothetical protein